MMMAALPKDEAPPDASTLRLSNQPGSSGESVPLEALVGRKVGDMGFRYVRLHDLTRYSSRSERCMNMLT